MSASSGHLNERQKLDLARGIVEHGWTVDHLEECDRCAAEVEQLSSEEEASLYAGAPPDTPPDWLREAGVKARGELEPARAGHDVESPISGQFTIRPASNQNGAENDQSSRRSLPRSGAFIAGAGSVVLVAAAVVLYVQSGPRAYERDGGVSAELFCAAPGSGLIELGQTGGTCPRGAELVVNAVAAPDNRLPYLTVVACEGTRCESVSRARFDGSSEVTVAGSVMGPRERVDMILVWSDRELSDEALAGAAKSLTWHAGVPSLALPESWAQVGFSVRAVDR